MALLVLDWPVDGEVQGENGVYDFNSPAPGARLMVCKIGQGDGEDDIKNLVSASISVFDFIVGYNKKILGIKHQKVNVISISLAFTFFNKHLARAVHQAVDNDVIVVSCASNDGANLANPIGYPA